MSVVSDQAELQAVNNINSTTPTQGIADDAKSIAEEISHHLPTSAADPETEQDLVLLLILTLLLVHFKHLCLAG